ncbi:MAG: Asp-tRNA(Asn)/Glu-tRNA(Gln) amidotransferase subunit GatC [Patescibacteria group bacterium]|nr:Asp-tRNA(Asn)/Glu-tRNA(Gln) amidotransferase subunit GatC [Patescibacteria group bacterium]
MITKAEVEKVAKLARIEITEPEKEKFAKQLTNILDYVNQLSEVNTENVSPTSQVTELNNVMRADEIEPYKDPVALVEKAPESRDGQIKVKSILG